MWKAAFAVATSTGWSNVTTNPVRAATPLAIGAVGSILARVAARVTNAARVGTPSWWPVASVAFAPTVIE